jgi:hypothetical protein
MSDNFVDIYVAKVTVNNTVYFVKSCCNENHLCISIYPTFQDIPFEEQEMSRPITDGKVDWFTIDYKDPVTMSLMPVAEEIAKKTTELMHRTWKMKAFL